MASRCFFQHKVGVGQTVQYHIGETTHRSTGVVAVLVFHSVLARTSFKTKKVYIYISYYIYSLIQYIIYIHFFQNLQDALLACSLRLLRRRFASSAWDSSATGQRTPIGGSSTSADHEKGGSNSLMGWKTSPYVGPALEAFTNEQRMPLKRTLGKPSQEGPIAQVL